jgi:hypothetical protein
VNTPPVAVAPATRPLAAGGTNPVLPRRTAPPVVARAPAASPPVAAAKPAAATSPAPAQQPKSSGDSLLDLIKSSVAKGK